MTSCSLPEYSPAPVTACTCVAAPSHNESARAKACSGQRGDCEMCVAALLSLAGMRLSCSAEPQACTTQATCGSRISMEVAVFQQLPQRALNAHIHKVDQVKVGGSHCCLVRELQHTQSGLRLTGLCATPDARSPDYRASKRNRQPAEADSHRLCGDVLPCKTTRWMVWHETGTQPAWHDRTKWEQHLATWLHTTHYWV